MGWGGSEKRGRGLNRKFVQGIFTRYVDVGGCKNRGDCSPEQPGEWGEEQLKRKNLELFNNTSEGETLRGRVFNKGGEESSTLKHVHRAGVCGLRGIGLAVS